MKSIALKSMAAAVLSLSLLTSAQAITWDASADFLASGTTNPNGVWSYGYDPSWTAGYQLAPFDNYIGGTVVVWNSSTYQASNAPALIFNGGSDPVNGVPQGWIALHPGPVANDDAAILRFTAPTTGLYDVSAQFFAGHSGETDAWVIQNGNAAAPLSSLGVTSSDPSFALLGLHLNAGETLDFVVGNHGAFEGDTTPLQVAITQAVPEPATWWMLCGGLGVLLGTRAVQNSRAFRRGDALSSGRG